MYKVSIKWLCETCLHTFWDTGDMEPEVNYIGPSDVVYCPQCYEEDKLEIIGTMHKEKTSV